MEKTMELPDIDPLCVDCGVDTEAIQEFFDLKDEVWEEVVRGNAVPAYKVLCVGCVECRLGRQLRSTDFTDARVNLYGTHSERLHNRIATP